MLRVRFLQKPQNSDKNDVQRISNTNKFKHKAKKQKNQKSKNKKLGMIWNEFWPGGEARRADFDG